MKASIRILALLLALCLVLAGCSSPASSGAGGTSSLPSSGTDASTVTDGAAAGGSAGDQASSGQRYAFAIRDARDPEDNQSSGIASGDAGADPFFAVNPNDLTSEESAGQISMMLQILGVDPASLDAYAFSVSLMNVRAYAIGVFKPSNGKADEVMAALEEYVSLQQQSFEQYLEDQYTIAKGALLRTLPGGEIVLVMSEDAAGIMASLEEALA